MRRNAIIAGLVLVTSHRALALNIALDYSNDSTNFFGNPAAKAALEKAAADLSSVITTALSPITTTVFTGTSGSTTAMIDWSASYTNPTTGSAVTLDNFTAAANTYTIYVGARSLTGTTLGQGGAGGAGYQISGGGQSSQWVAAAAAAESASNAAMKRGTPVIFGSFSDSVALGSASADFHLSYAPIVGNMWFDNDSNNDGNIDSSVVLGNYWNFDFTSTSFAGKNDFYSVALHEMIHSLGFGDSDSWSAEHSGTTWLGNRAITLNGNTGVGLLASDQAHIVSSYSSTVVGSGVTQEAVMDPTLTTGTRKLMTQMDLAMLGDMGYTVVPEAGTTGMLVVGMGAVLWLVRRRIA